jgi:hypothetical protein
MSALRCAMLSDDEARTALATHPFPANPWVQVTDEAVLIKAGYNEAMQRMLRWVPQARWRRDMRCWWVPLNGIELVRSVLPEVSRLAEAMQEETGTALAARAHTGPEHRHVGDAEAQGASTDAHARFAFWDAARMLYGSDWQRETAHALGRDEAALACWLVGQGVTEAPAKQLLDEMLTLMRRRAADILAAAEVLQSRSNHLLPP